MAKLSIVPKVSPGSVTLDQIPQEFVDEIEQAYEALRSNSNHELRVEFDDREERSSWLRMAKSYGEQRMDAKGDSARLKIYAIPKRNLPKTIAYVAIKPDLEGNGSANTHR